MALESKVSGWREVVVEVEMEVGGGSGVVVARVSCWWCPAGSFVDAASPGKFPRPQAAIGANWKLALFPFALTRCSYGMHVY